jgi:hypothetical protein
MELFQIAKVLDSVSFPNSYTFLYKNLLKFNILKLSTSLQTEFSDDLTYKFYERIWITIRKADKVLQMTFSSRLLVAYFMKGSVAEGICQTSGGSFRRIL